MTAFDECGLDLDFYALREREYGEVLPWSVVSAGVKDEYLWSGRTLSRANEKTPDCREKCSGCGAC